MINNIVQNPFYFIICSFDEFLIPSIFFFLLQGAGMILSLEQSMPDQLRSTFKGLFIKTLTFVTTIYVMFGIAGYLSFGPDTKEIITLNLEPEGGIDFALIVKVCLCFSLFFTYPVMMFPVTKIITPKVQQFITIEVSSHSNTKCTISFKNILRLFQLFVYFRRLPYLDWVYDLYWFQLLD